MKKRRDQAAAFFGLSIVGFLLCGAVAFVASNTDSKSPEQTPAYRATANSSKPVTAPESTVPEPTIATVAETLDPASVEKGKQNYEMFCLACHGAENTTINSPSNLFDTNWYHGSGREGIEMTIRDGIMEKGMPGWGAMIPAEDITALVDYLISFQNP